MDIIMEKLCVDPFREFKGKKNVQSLVKLWFSLLVLTYVKNFETVQQIWGLTLTFQLTSLVASDNLDVTTTIPVWLLAKLASGNKKPQAKTEFQLVCG